MSVSSAVKEFEAELFGARLVVEVHPFSDSVCQRDFGPVQKQFLCPCIVLVSNNIGHILSAKLPGKIREIQTRASEDEKEAGTETKGQTTTSLATVVASHGKKATKFIWGSRWLCLLSRPVLSAIMDLAQNALLWVGAIEKKIPYKARTRAELVQFIMNVVSPYAVLDSRKHLYPTKFSTAVGSNPLPMKFYVDNPNQLLDQIWMRKATPAPKTETPVSLPYSQKPDEAMVSCLRSCYDLAKKHDGACYDETNFPLPPDWFEFFKVQHKNLLHLIPHIDISAYRPKKLPPNSDSAMLCGDTGMTTVSLNDPVTHRRLKFPCRGIGCLHWECMDLLNVLSMFMQHTHITCPLCKSVLVIDEIRIDIWMWKILVCAPPEWDSVSVSHSGVVDWGRMFDNTLFGSWDSGFVFPFSPSPVNKDNAATWQRQTCSLEDTAGESNNDCDNNTHMFASTVNGNMFMPIPGRVPSSSSSSAAPNFAEIVVNS